MRKQLLGGGTHAGVYSEELLRFWGSNLRLVGCAWMCFNQQLRHVKLACSFRLCFFCSSTPWGRDWGCLHANCHPPAVNVYICIYVYTGSMYVWVQEHIDAEDWTWSICIVRVDSDTPLRLSPSSALFMGWPFVNCLSPVFFYSFLTSRHLLCKPPRHWEARQPSSILYLPWSVSPVLLRPWDRGVGPRGEGFPKAPPALSVFIFLALLLSASHWNDDPKWMPSFEIFSTLL